MKQKLAAIAIAAIAATVPAHAKESSEEKSAVDLRSEITMNVNLYVRKMVLMCSSHGRYELVTGEMPKVSDAEGCIRRFIGNMSDWLDTVGRNGRILVPREAREYAVAYNFYQMKALDVMNDTPPRKGENIVAYNARIEQNLRDLSEAWLPVETLVFRNYFTWRKL